MNFVNREVEFPNRKRLVPVEGEANVYYVFDAPGEVVEAGTPLTAENLNALKGSPDVANTIPYICNGVNDNEILSEMSQRFFNRQDEFEGCDEDASLYVYVIGSVGVPESYSRSEPHFNFGVGTYQGAQKLCFDWEHAHLEINDGVDLQESLSTAIFNSVGEGYIEQRNAHVTVHMCSGSYIPDDAEDHRWRSLYYSVFSGSYGKYVDCECKLLASVNGYGQPSIYISSSHTLEAYVHAYSGTNNTYENCKGFVYAESYSSIYPDISQSASYYYYNSYLTCSVFQGGDNVYNECEGYTYAEAPQAYFYSESPYADFTVYTSAAAVVAYDVANSEFYGCTFGAMNGDNSTAYGITDYVWGGYYVIENCKFPLMTFGTTYGKTNYGAMPINLYGHGNNVTVSNNIFSNQLLSSNFPNNATVSGNVTTALSKTVPWW